MTTDHPHPYYPQDVVLPGFQTQVLSMAHILGVFFSITAVVIVLTYSLASKYKYLSVVDKLQMCWFLASGLIHFFVEGAVVTQSKFYQDTSGNILLEIWKEYTKADSRYATRDAFVIQMEAVTAFAWGPLCWVCVYAIAKHKSWRFSPMIVVSIGQIYGDVLYYLTCYHEGFGKHSRPEFLYFWFYFVIINAIWIVLPSIITYSAIVNVNKALAAYHDKPKKN